MHKQEGLDRIETNPMKALDLTHNREAAGEWRNYMEL